MNQIQYDGTTPLPAALAGLLGFSSKDTHRSARLIKEACQKLGLTGGANHFRPAEKLAVYQWHRERLAESMAPFGKTEGNSFHLGNGVTERNNLQSQAGQGERNSFQTARKGAEANSFQSGAGAEGNSLHSDGGRSEGNNLHFDSHKKYSVNIRLARNGAVRRFPVELEGYYLDTLVKKAGLNGTGAIGHWIEDALAADAGPSEKNLTSRIRRLIFLAVTQ